VLERLNTLIYRKKRDFRPQPVKARERAKRWWASKSLQESLLLKAKTRADKKGYEFNLEPEDILIPEICPYLKTPFIKGTMYAPSLDRVDNDKGYIKGNVEVISRKANLMKSNASSEELLEFAYTILERN
jgi:hypothetical protein